MPDEINDQKFFDDTLYSANGRYGIGGNTGDARFGPHPTGVLGVSAPELTSFESTDNKGKRADTSFSRNMITRPNNRISDRR